MATGSLFRPSPFDLILEGARNIISEQEQAAGKTMEQQRQDALIAALAEPPPEEFVDSTAIESFAYDASIEALSVRWRDSREGPPHEYLYYGVNEAIAAGLEAADSKGTYMNEVIKAGYFPFTRLS